MGAGQIGPNEVALVGGQHQLDDVVVVSGLMGGQHQWGVSGARPLGGASGSSMGVVGLGPMGETSNSSLGVRQMGGNEVAVVGGSFRWLTWW